MKPPYPDINHRLDDLPHGVRIERRLRQPWIDRHDHGELAENTKAGGEIEDAMLEGLAVSMICDGIGVGEVLEPPPSSAA